MFSWGNEYKRLSVEVRILIGPRWLSEVSLRINGIG